MDSGGPRLRIGFVVAEFVEVSIVADGVVKIGLVDDCMAAERAANDANNTSLFDNIGTDVVVRPTAFVKAMVVPSVSSVVSELCSPAIRTSVGYCFDVIIVLCSFPVTPDDNGTISEVGLTRVCGTAIGATKVDVSYKVSAFKTGFQK